MAQLCIRVGNFLGQGEMADPSGTSNKLTLIRVRLGRRLVEIHQDPSLEPRSSRKFHGCFVETTTLRLRGIFPAKRRYPSIVDDLCWLLSLASMSRVVPYGLDTIAGEHRWSVMGAVGKSWALINIEDGKQVRQFLESTFPSLAAMRGKRRFTSCIDALLHAEAGVMPTELRMVAAYVTLEMLKDHWARTQRLEFARGRFWATTSRGKARPYTFEELLKGMCDEVGMQVALREIVPYRNALIHSGGMRLRNRTKDRAYNAIQRMAREYMLRRLNYHGAYFRFGDPHRMGQL
jgi:hypothetical protein